jgi:hypothetical protein
MYAVHLPRLISITRREDRDLVATGYLCAGQFAHAPLNSTTARCEDGGRGTNADLGDTQGGMVLEAALRARDHNQCTSLATCRVGTRYGSREVIGKRPEKVAPVRALDQPL